MPELPEVETLARQLSPLLRGRTIEKIVLHDPKLKGDFSAVRGAVIDDIRRIGKQVVLALNSRSSPPLYLAVHLRMTGRLIWEPAGGRGAEDVPVLYYREPETPSKKPPRAVVHCSGGELRFHDTRRFGTMLLSRTLTALQPTGVDPNSEQFTAAGLRKLLQGSSQPLKNWLLRQDKIAGLGNIYACEILHAAKLSPFAEAGSLDVKAASRLHRQTRRILQKAIENCGTTFSDFQQSDGSIGGYQCFLKVYGRAGEPCRSCGSAILRHKQVGRSTFYCPYCQPDP